MGQAFAYSAMPMAVDSCFDVAAGMIVGGAMDGIVPHPAQVTLYTDSDGMQRAAIDVAGDNKADLPVCAPDIPEIPPPMIPPPEDRIPPPPPPPPPPENGGGEYCPPTDCTTYERPPVVVGPDGCDIGYNGCGDTVGVLAAGVLAGATVDVNVAAAIEFTPRYFISTSPLTTFTIDRIFVANGPNSNFGAGYSVDYYGLTSFTSKRVSWPTFYNSPPLTITITNTTGGAADFSGLLIGIAAHQ